MLGCSSPEAKTASFRLYLSDCWLELVSRDFPELHRPKDLVMKRENSLESQDSMQLSVQGIHVETEAGNSFFSLLKMHLSIRKIEMHRHHKIHRRSSLEKRTGMTRDSRRSGSTTNVTFLRWMSFESRMSLHVRSLWQDMSKERHAKNQNDSRSRPEDVSVTFRGMKGLFVYEWMAFMYLFRTHVLKECLCHISMLFYSLNVVQRIKTLNDGKWKQKKKLDFINTNTTMAHMKDKKDFRLFFEL